MKKYMKNNKKNRTREKRNKIRNRKLCKKYPWLIPRYIWTDKIVDDYDYSYIEWGCAKGWDVAYGNMYLEELGTAVEKAGLKHKFRIYQIKEKYGSHRVYVNDYTQEISDIISKYERLSENICIRCGKPDVPMIYDGWYSPWCYNCFRKNWRSREEYIAKNRQIDVASEEKIKSTYNECICSDENCRMRDSYTINVYRSGNITTRTVDISDTAKKIRLRWEKRHRGKK